MFASIKYLLACLALVVAVASSHAAAITNSVTFNFEDILQRAYVNRSVTVESVSTPRTNSPNIAVNYYLSTNTGTSGSFVLSNMLDGTYRVSVLGNPRPTTFLIGVPTNNPGTHYASDLLTTNIDANATTAWTRSQADSRYVRANTTNGVLISPTNFFWANITNGANVAIARGASGKLTISATNSGGGTTDGASLTNFLGAPANATEAALRGITNAIHIVNIPGAADGIGTALSPRNATNSTVFDNILSNAPNGTVIKLGPQLFWTKGAAATGRARFWGTQNEFGIEGQNGTILRLDPTNNTAATSIVAVYLGTAGSGATSNYFVRNIAVELNPYNFPTNIALQGIQLYGDGLEISGSKLSGIRGRLQNGGAEAFGIVVDDAGSSAATLPRVISRNYVGNSDSNTIDTTSAIYGTKASVINNTVDDTNTYAITLGSGSSYVGNRVVNSKYGFWADTAPVSNVVAVANHIKGVSGAVTLFPGSGVFSGVTFSENMLYGDAHVVLLNGNGGMISNATFANNKLYGTAGNNSVLNLQAVHNSVFVNNQMSTGLVYQVGASNTIFQNNRFFDGTAATTNSFYGGLFVNGGLDADYIQNTRLTNIASIDLTTGGYIHMNNGGNGAEFRSASSLRPSVVYGAFNANDISLRTEFIFATNSSAGIMIQRPANTNQLEVKLGDNSTFGDLWVANLYTNGVQVTGGSGGGSQTPWTSDIDAAEYRLLSLDYIRFTADVPKYLWWLTNDADSGAYLPSTGANSGFWLSSDGYSNIVLQGGVVDLRRVQRMTLLNGTQYTTNGNLLATDGSGNVYSAGTISNITIQLAGMSSNQIVVTGEDGQFTNLALNPNQFVTNVGSASGSPSLAIKSGGVFSNFFLGTTNGASGVPFAGERLPAMLHLIAPTNYTSQAVNQNSPSTNGLFLAGYHNRGASFGTNFYFDSGRDVSATLITNGGRLHLGPLAVQGGSIWFGPLSSTASFGLLGNNAGGSATPHVAGYFMSAPNVIVGAQTIVTPGGFATDGTIWHGLGLRSIGNTINHVDSGFVSTGTNRITAAGGSWTNGAYIQMRQATVSNLVPDSVSFAGFGVTNIGGVAYPAIVDGNTNVVAFGGFTNQNGIRALVVYTNGVRNYALLATNLAIVTNTVVVNTAYTAPLDRNGFLFARATLTGDDVDAGILYVVVDGGVPAYVDNISSLAQRQCFSAFIPRGSTYYITNISAGGGTASVDAASAIFPP